MLQIVDETAAALLRLEVGAIIAKGLSSSIAKVVSGVVRLAVACVRSGLLSGVPVMESTQPLAALRCACTGPALPLALVR